MLYCTARSTAPFVPPEGVQTTMAVSGLLSSPIPSVLKHSVLKQAGRGEHHLCCSQNLSVSDHCLKACQIELAVAYAAAAAAVLAAGDTAASFVQTDSSAQS